MLGSLTKPKIRWIFPFGFLLVVAMVFLASAWIRAQIRYERKLGLLDLYQRIDEGMPRERVEEILGPPLWAQDAAPGADLRVDYLDQEYAERSLLPHESPMAPAGIYVIYRHGKLVEKSYNSQWVNEPPRPWWRFW